jgi:heme exporter protein CcmD
MNWDALFTLEGHGAYVWSSFGVCFTLMAAEVASLRRRTRKAERRA